ncbi:CsbD family protein [Streptomyces sp. cg28]
MSGSAPCGHSETAGRAVGNERLTAEGRAQQMKGDARQAKEKTKDIGKH